MTGQRDIGGARADHAAFARQGRLVAMVIAAAGLLAIFAPLLAGWAGLSVRIEMLFYFASMAGFVWALVMALGMWRRRPGDEG